MFGLSITGQPPLLYGRPFIPYDIGGGSVDPPSGEVLVSVSDGVLYDMGHIIISLINRGFL